MNDLSQARKLIAACKETQNPYLDLGNCGITDLNELPELFECSHLETLILSNKWWDNESRKWINSSNKGRENKISSIPVEISNLKQLTKLIIGGDWENRWNITDYSFLQELNQLQALYLSFNQITDISFLQELNQLQTLYLSGNQITDISFLQELNQLHSLYLSNNQITDISFLQGLNQLHTLNLSYNNLKEIPEFIFQLGMEINMNEYSNNGLCLYNNPITSPPLEIIKQGKQSVLNWFKAKKKKLNEIKIILIGEPKAGKTSLLKRLKDNTFDENEVQTDGVNIEDIEFGKNKTFENQTFIHDITGHFWDFGGQEIMNATHQFFLTKRSVYVLVLDARKDANNAVQIRDWVMRVKTTGGDSPIIVVANQIDVNPGFGFVNERELQNEFPQIKCFIKLSCKTEENLELFKEKLTELIPTAELFNTDIDERWIKIKDKLQEETKKDYFLNESRFFKICDGFNLKEKQEQKNAITFLHDLGLVLHFEDLNLTDYYVLNPYWITYGVYQILTSIYAGKKKGIVRMDKLEYIVNEEEDKKDVYNSPDYKKITYTNPERRFLIDILHHFKLCFCISDRSRFIIPDLLDTSEPLKTTEPIKSSSEDIRFMYKYDYLPKSIMPNIMVETHSILKEKWRTGCVLHKDGCKALITSYEKRITIIVTGEHKKKREFMSVIRYIIDSINVNLTNKPKMLIPLPKIEDIDKYPDYEELLEKEKDGEEYYTVYKPEKKKFEISVLLEGIRPKEEEVEIKELLSGMKRDIEKMKHDNVVEIKTIPIFLASSEELKEDRKEFEIFINRENKELVNKGIFLKLELWEDFIDEMSKTRLQDEYNKAAINSDIFVSLFWTKTGKYTSEEFNEAYKHFKEKGKPSIYTYFKNTPISPNIDTTSRFKFIEELKVLGHYPTNYENIDNLKYQFKKQLQKILPELA